MTNFRTTVLDMIRPGDQFKVGEGFGCTPEGTIVTIDRHAAGLFFPCEEGMHYLDGQVDGDGPDANVLANMILVRRVDDPSTDPVPLPGEPEDEFKS